MHRHPTGTRSSSSAPGRRAWPPDTTLPDEASTSLSSKPAVAWATSGGSGTTHCSCTRPPGTTSYRGYGFRWQATPFRPVGRWPTTLRPTPTITSCRSSSASRSIDLGVTDTGDGANDRYTISAGDRHYEANQVIVATGAFQRPQVPELARRLDPGIRQLHSAEYHGPHQLVEGPVLIVGLSHSGADIAYELSTAGHRTFVSGKAHGQLPFSVDSRRARLAWPMMRFLAWNVLTLSTPIGRKMAPKVRAGGGPLLRIRRGDLESAGVTQHEARTVDVDGRGRPVLADGTALDVANVVWCTGFRPDYGWVDLPVIGEDGWPRERRGVVDESPGLYFLGIPFLYSFTSMLVLGAGRDAAHVVDRLAARAADRLRGVAVPEANARVA